MNTKFQYNVTQFDFKEVLLSTTIDILHWVKSLPCMQPIRNSIPGKQKTNKMIICNHYNHNIHDSKIFLPEGKVRTQRLG